MRKILVILIIMAVAMNQFRAKSPVTRFLAENVVGEPTEHEGETVHEEEGEGGIHLHYAPWTKGFYMSIGVSIF